MEQGSELGGGPQPDHGQDRAGQGSAASHEPPIGRAAFSQPPVLGLEGASATAGTLADAPLRGRVHELPSTPETVRVGAMDPAARVVLEIDSGDVVRYTNTWLNWGNEPKYGMSFAEREPIRKRYPQGPFSLVGPVAIRGAEAGDAIECRMLLLRPIEWGWNSAPLGVGALPSDFTTSYLQYFRFDADRRTTEFGKGVRIPLAPVQSVMATQPASTVPVSALLVGRHGGLVALRQLTVGRSLFLPVEVAGARLWTGGSWAAVGDGVVDNTAIETAMEDLRIQYVLHKRVALDGPIAETDAHWIVLGFDVTLDGALTAALRRTITWLSAATSLSKQEVYALCSIAGDFRASQYSHQVSTVYASKQPQAMYVTIPKAVFDDETTRRIAASLGGAPSGSTT
jgi:acetamidase/formamidase